MTLESKLSNIRIGDIKKFITSSGEIVGVVIDVINSPLRFEVIDIEGCRREIYSFSYVIKDVTSVRLDKNLRDILTNIGDTSKERYIILKDEQEIMGRKRALCEKIKEQHYAFIKVLGE